MDQAPPPLPGRLAALALTCAALLGPAGARAASFDCAKARAPDERAICADPGLNNLDSRLAGLLDLDEDTVAMGQRGDMQDAQSAWLKMRAKCGAGRLPAGPLPEPPEAGDRSSGGAPLRQERAALLSLTRFWTSLVWLRSPEGRA